MKVAHRSLIAVGARPSLHWENPKKLRDFKIASVDYSDETSVVLSLTSA